MKDNGIREIQKYYKCNIVLPGSIWKCNQIVEADKESN